MHGGGKHSFLVSEQDIADYKKRSKDLSKEKSQDLIANISNIIEIVVSHLLCIF